MLPIKVNGVSIIFDSIQTQEVIIELITLQGLDRQQAQADLVALVFLLDILEPIRVQAQILLEFKL